MPHDKLEVETDGDPKTELEDVDVHDRTGFLITERTTSAQPDEGTKQEVNAPIVRRDEL